MQLLKVIFIKLFKMIWESAPHMEEKPFEILHTDPEEISTG